MRLSIRFFSQACGSKTNKKKAKSKPAPFKAKGHPRSAECGLAYGWKLNSNWTVVSVLAGAYFQLFSVSSTAFTSNG